MWGGVGQTLQALHPALAFQLDRISGRQSDQVLA